MLLAGIIDPCDTEGNHALRLDQALDDVNQLRVLREHRLHGGQHLLHSLAKAGSVFKSLCWVRGVSGPSDGGNVLCCARTVSQIWVNYCGACA